jgi:hypothetical protein
MKLNSTDKNVITAIAIVFALILVISVVRSGYQPKEIKIKTLNTGSIFDLETKEKCPGDGYYTNSRGAVCGAQKLVKDQASYKIEG